MMDEAGVDRVVIVPPGLNDRNDYALEAAKRYPHRFGVMGRIPLQEPKSAALLPTWKQQPGMLGVRVTFNTPPTLAWLSDGTADWFWPAAEKAGLAVMFLAVGEVPRFARIAERHPQLTLIIDHMGMNSSSRTNRISDIPAAIDQAVALAKYPNVSVKLSGAVGNSLEPYPFRDMTVYLQRLFDAYGPQRCYWGTDITNSFAAVISEAGRCSSSTIGTDIRASGCSCLPDTRARNTHSSQSTRATVSNRSHFGFLERRLRRRTARRRSRSQRFQRSRNTRNHTISLRPHLTST